VRSAQSVFPAAMDATGPQESSPAVLIPHNMRQAGGHGFTTGSSRQAKETQTEPMQLAGEPAQVAAHGADSQWEHPIPIQDLIAKMRRENEAMEEHTKELQYLITLVADGHLLARRRQARLVAENLFMQDLRTRLRQPSPGPPGEPAVNAAGGRRGPLPGQPLDLQVVGVAMREIMSGRGLPPDLALATLARAAVQGAGSTDQDTVQRLRSMHAALSAEAAPCEPDFWEDCD